jgi:hypothetical protein
MMIVMEPSGEVAREPSERVAGCAGCAGGVHVAGSVWVATDRFLASRSVWVATVCFLASGSVCVATWLILGLAMDVAMLASLLEANWACLAAVLVAFLIFLLMVRSSAFLSLLWTVVRRFTLCRFRLKNRIRSSLTVATVGKEFFTSVVTWQRLAWSKATMLLKSASRLFSSLMAVIITFFFFRSLIIFFFRYNYTNNSFAGTHI